jgi:hypothetical protein
MGVGLWIMEHGKVITLQIIWELLGGSWVMNRERSCLQRSEDVEFVYGSWTGDKL